MQDHPLTLVHDLPTILRMQIVATPPATKLRIYVVPDCVVPSLEHAWVAMPELAGVERSACALCGLERSVGVTVTYARRSRSHCLLTS